MIRLMLICAAAAIAIVNAAYAQNTPVPVETNPANPPRNEESSVALTKPEPKSLVGTRVRTSSGEELGTVEEVMADEAGGREFVILKIGEDRFTAMPMSAVNLMMRDKVLVIDRAQLEGAPHMGTDWRRHVSNDAWSQSEGYWSKQKEMRSATPNESQDPAQKR